LVRAFCLECSGNPEASGDTALDYSRNVSVINSVGGCWFLPSLSEGLGEGAKLSADKPSPPATAKGRGRQERRRRFALPAHSKGSLFDKRPPMLLLFRF